MSRLSIEELKIMDLQQLDSLLEDVKENSVDASYIQDIEVVIGDKLDEF